MKKNLIIWDFDGVIADTEKLWLKNRQIMLNEIYGLNWNIEKVNQLLRGMSDKTKEKVLRDIGINTDKAFWEKSIELDIKTMNEEGFILTPDIEEIFKLTNIKQCIATGGVWDKTLFKIKIAGIESYFPSNRVYTADMVQNGKPEPDIFLLAAQKMEEDPKNAVVIEDSIAGLVGAIRAGCLPIAFLGGDLINDQNHLEQVKALGVKNIFNNMVDVKNFLETIF